MRYVEDPSIAAAARAEHADMMAEILRRYEAGEPYFRAREAVMAERGPAIAKAHGKETAKRALAAVCSHSVADLPRASRMKNAVVFHDQWLERLNRWDGPTRRWSARQRFFIELLGTPHWATHTTAAASGFGLAAALVGGAWLMGWSTWPGIACAALAFAIAADGVLFSTMPGGKALTGQALKDWRATQLEAEISAAGQRMVDAERAEEARRADEQSLGDAQRTLRDFVKNAERDERARGNSVLGQAPAPLDDFGKAFLRPRGSR